MEDNISVPLDLRRVTAVASFGFITVLIVWILPEYQSAFPFVIKVRGGPIAQALWPLAAILSPLVLVHAVKVARWAAIMGGSAIDVEDGWVRSPFFQKIRLDDVEYVKIETGKRTDVPRRILIKSRLVDKAYSVPVGVLSSGGLEIIVEALSPTVNSAG